MLVILVLKIGHRRDVYRRRPSGAFFSGFVGDEEAPAALGDVPVF